MRVENNVDAACVFIFGQNFRPGLAAVGCTKNSALLIRTKCVTQRRYENHILVSGVDNQCADLPRIFQPDVLPGFAAIDRFEHPGPVRRVAADRRLARSDINHVVIRWRDCDCADRRNGCFIEKRSPICAAVSRLPNSAGDRAEIIRVRFADYTFDGERAATAKRTDLSPTHFIEKLPIDRSRQRWGGGWSRLKRAREKENKNSETDSK